MFKLPPLFETPDFFAYFYPMTTFLLSLHGRIVYRYLAELGWFRLLLLAGLIVWLTSKVIINFIVTGNSGFLITFLLVLSILSFHLFRPDRDFIQTHSENPAFLFLIEYGILSLPFFIFLIIFRDFISAGSLILLTSFISFISFRIRKKSGWFSFSFPVLQTAIEWSSGLRKTWILIILLELIALSLGWKEIAASPAVLFVLMLIITSYYTPCEPENMILALGHSPGSFLRLKFRQAIFGWTSVSIVPFLLFLFSFPEFGWILFSGWIYGFLVISISLSAKYAFYSGNEKTGMIRDVMTGLVIVAPFNIFITWLPLVLLPWLIRKSLRNLNRLCW
ncbi:MAG: hypothetical protein J0L62_10625 [Bacteroidetes bacterium]|nr:hypothetical protein [Bacteroidota bacterium]